MTDNPDVGAWEVRRMFTASLEQLWVVQRQIYGGIEYILDKRGHRKRFKSKAGALDAISKMGAA